MALVPVLFVGVIRAPHGATVRARNALLVPLAEEFARTLNHSGADEERAADAFKMGTDYLEGLRRRYEVIEATYPTWPVRVRRVAARFSLAAITPLISTYLIPLINADLVKSLASILR
jgi:hypothetical protein